MSADVVKLPTTIPSPDQLDLPRAQLCTLLGELSAYLAVRQMELVQAGNAAGFAAVVRTITEKLGEASAGWATISNTIRESWRV